ncbi:germination protein, Ger(x)C family [Paenibacillus curdlanolyticus YK9]|uniref:Germination protein, Ger(X)C family n=1 Tax=Paenibacillus curdlanolyticus YK9 TaxID=717606 RepID=E0IDN6_9BACL|nr:Ger(x)C family spore germination C-terminal domain-containing protein [Paenibacillus curdlanolyticus]EFM09240.1 germination protein, Ger(x)C family [Paenibacillus curdlanolyticus YK9]
MIRIRLMMLAALIGLTITMLSGCGFKDIDKRFFVVSTGIDRTDNPDKPYRVTLRLAIPSPKTEPGASKSQMETIETATIAEGVRLLKAHVDKELDFGHCKVFVFGESLVRSDYAEALTWMLRRRDIQSVADVAIGRPTAHDVLYAEPPSERYPGNTLFLSFGTQGTDSPFTVQQFIFDFERRFMERGLDPLLPVIKRDQMTYMISKVAFLDKKQMKLMLTSEETQQFNQLNFKFIKSSLRADYKGEKIVAVVSSISRHYRIVESNGQATIKMKVRIKCVLEQAPRDLYNTPWGPIEKAFGEQYSAAAEALFTKIRDANVDPYGFGLRYRATHIGSDATWNRWLKLYPDAKFEVSTSVHIDGTGLIK